MNNYYVYIHEKATTGEPFYIGKGKYKRSEQTHGRNEHWHNVVKKHGYTIRHVAECLSSSDALELEELIIETIGLHNLTNITPGGEGVSNPSYKTRSKRSKYKKSNLPMWLNEKNGTYTFRPVNERGFSAIGTNNKQMAFALAETFNQAIENGEDIKTTYLKFYEAYKNVDEIETNDVELTDEQYGECFHKAEKQRRIDSIVKLRNLKRGQNEFAYSDINENYEYERREKIDVKHDAFDKLNNGVRFSELSGAELDIIQQVLNGELEITERKKKQSRKAKKDKRNAKRRQWYAENADKERERRKQYKPSEKQQFKMNVLNCLKNEVFNKEKCLIRQISEYLNASEKRVRSAIYNNNEMWHLYAQRTNIYQKQ